MDDQTSLVENHEFIADCARYAEGLLSEKEVKKKHRFDNATWERLGENDALVEAIEAEKTRRIRNGSTKRERAQQLIAQAPGVLGDIMLDANASPKHRIDSAKALDTFAANGPEAAPAMDRFQITIVLSADGTDHIERYDKAINVNPNDIDPNETGSALEESAFVMITTKKSQDNDNGGHL